MNKTIQVSIIIVNYNTLHVLLPCLDNIVKYTSDIEYEIIVVDNGSKDESIETLSNDKRIIFIPTGENLGFGKANNIGLQHAKGEYILFLNSDTLLRNNAIKMLYDYAKNYKGKLGGLGCVLEDIHGNPIHSYGYMPTIPRDIEKLLFIPIKKALRIYHQPEIFPKNWMKVEYITGADLFVRRSVLNECGSFHPAFFMYCEEVEMQQRFAMRGYENVLINGPRIVHLEGEGSKDGKSSKFLRDNFRQERSQHIYFKLLLPRWKYYLYRVIHALLRQTLWFNPKVSFADKCKIMKQQFITITI